MLRETEHKAYHLLYEIGRPSARRFMGTDHPYRSFTAVLMRTQYNTCDDTKNTSPLTRFRTASAIKSSRRVSVATRKNGGSPTKHSILNGNVFVSCWTIVLTAALFGVNWLPPCIQRNKDKRRRSEHSFRKSISFFNEYNQMNRRCKRFSCCSI